MTNERRVVEEVVTKFLLNTTRLRPQLTGPAVQAALSCVMIATDHPVDDKEVDYIPLTTGSVAEFYIEPMLPHIGDIDVMFNHSTQLAIPDGHSPPTQLPAEFDNYDIKVFEIIDSHFSGYVYLELCYLLTECVNDGRYNAVEYNRGVTYLSNACFPRADVGEIHGPAHLSPETVQLLPMDAVPCIRCLTWPPQAADWPTRHRNYGWPDSATVDRVVSNGCDVVPVAHRQCRQHKWLGKCQWRLSFSRAEIVLINSWMPVQQIVYHMLRVFVKTERLTESDNYGTGTLSNYHNKTLMLWACELKPNSWWTDDLNLMRLCVQLLHNLAIWLKEAQCQHYFINTCNLVDKSFGPQIVDRLLVDTAWLSSWFVNNYIRKCAEVCPESVLRLFDDVSTSMKLENAVSAVVDWRLNTVMIDFWDTFAFAELLIALHSSAVDIVYEMTEFAKLDERLSVYCTGLVFLVIAQKIERGGVDENLLKILAASVDHFRPIASSNYYSERVFSSLDKIVAVVRKCQQSAASTSDINTSELVELLQQSAVEHFTIFRQIEARDFCSVVTIVTADFEALYAYKRGDYQQCLQLSTQNVRKMYAAIRKYADLETFPVFIPWLDDDIVSLTALILIVDPECRSASCYVGITQLTLSLYMMTQCQLKLRHSVMSLAQTLDYIEVAQRRHSVNATLDQLTLKLIARRVMTYVTS